MPHRSLHRITVLRQSLDENRDLPQFVKDQKYVVVGSDPDRAIEDLKKLVGEKAGRKRRKEFGVLTAIVGLALAVLS